MQVTQYAKIFLGKTLYHLAQYHEAETIVLEMTKVSDLSTGYYGALNNVAHWYLALIWLALGKHDQSKELALKTINMIQEDPRAQPKHYTGFKEDLAQIWGINPDGTPFEGSVELGTDDSPNECETDNSSERVAENTGQRNAEQQ